MLYERKEIPELLFMKHRHDDDSSFIKYDDNILQKTTSSYLYKNDMMNEYLNKLQPLISILIDQMNTIKNFKNFMVDKYWYKHIG